MIPDYIFQIYTHWIFGDFVKWNKQEKILKQVIRTLILKQGSLVSWDSFAKEAEIKSHKTVSAYIEDLENMFVSSVIYYLDLNKKVIDYNKNKKIYFFDPFIYHIFNKMFYQKEYEIAPSLIEAVLVSNIAKFYSSTSEYNNNEYIFYWKNKKEIDVLIKDKDDIVPIEVKYQNKISKEDYASFYHFKGGILATKDLYQQSEKYLTIPIHLLLALI